MSPPRPLYERALALLVALLLVLGPPRISWAKRDGGFENDVVRAVAEAERFCAELEYQKARERLEPLVKSDALKSLRASLRARLWIALGRARAELGDMRGMEAAFREAVASDPSAELPPLVSPKIVAGLERARASLPVEPSAKPSPRASERPLAERENRPKNKTLDSAGRVELEADRRAQALVKLDVETRRKMEAEARRLEAEARRTDALAQQLETETGKAAQRRIKLGDELRVASETEARLRAEAEAKREEAEALRMEASARRAEASASATEASVQKAIPTVVGSGNLRVQALRLGNRVDLRAEFDLLSLPEDSLVWAYVKRGSGAFVAEPMVRTATVALLSTFGSERMELYVEAQRGDEVFARAGSSLEPIVIESLSLGLTPPPPVTQSARKGLSPEGTWILVGSGSLLLIGIVVTVVVLATGGRSDCDAGRGQGCADIRVQPLVSF